MPERVFILGGAQTDFERNWSKEGKGVEALLREAVTDGLNGALISVDELQELNVSNRCAIMVGNFCAEKYCNQGHLGALVSVACPELSGIPASRYEAACASGSVALDAAATKVRSGEYDVCVVIGWELMKTLDSERCGDVLGLAAHYDTEGRGVSFPFPKLFGRLADEILAKYQPDEDRFMEALSTISVQNYENAKRNPLAQTRRWYMSKEQAMARGSEGNALVGGRLAVSDCSQVTDGAAVVVICSEAYVKSSKLPVSEMIGWGHRTAPMLFDAKMAEARSSRDVLPWTRRAVLDAYGRAGIDVGDVDVFETHDCFTSSEYAALSSFGLCAPGDEIAGIEDGRYAFDGEAPINPSGGLIGCGHPVGASGVRMLLDLHRQVTGTAGGYQVPGARTGMMLNIGGSATTNYTYVVRRA